MTLREKQSEFARMVALLLIYINHRGYEVTFGDATRLDRKGHIRGSKHYSRLAIDLNLFKDGRYLRKTKDHVQFGVYWESIGGTWGGRFKNADGNHYEYGDGNPTFGFGGGSSTIIGGLIRI